MSTKQPGDQGKWHLRIPGWPRSRRKAKRPSWHKQATHMVVDVADLGLDPVLLTYWGDWDKSVATDMYRLDQALATARIPYLARRFGRYKGFDVWVPAWAASRASGVIAALAPAKRQEPERLHAWWSEIHPSNLPKHFAEHPWLFARYSVSGSSRGERKDYLAFLFRDRAWTVFGIREYLGRSWMDMARLATRVVTDPEFRQELISDDPEVARLWRRL